MRKIILIALLALSACGRPPEKTSEDTKSTVTTDFTLVRKCENGSELYRLSNGDLAQYNAPSEGEGYFVKFEGTIEEYCVEASS
jgi:hypothetical protein